MKLNIKRTIFFFFTGAILLLFSCNNQSNTSDNKYDVVVYGGTSAGVVAAIQAKRMGLSVVLVCPEKHLGGMTSGGLGWTDSGSKETIGGIAREFYQRLKNYYDQPEAWVYQKPEEYSHYRKQDDAMWVFEPHVAEQTFEKMIAEAGVPIHRDQWLDRKKGVKMKGSQIGSISMLNGEIYQGQIFIDATYEGDLMAAAGVSYTTGREANTFYNETLNGVQKKRAISHQFKYPVSPYIVPRDSTSGLVPLVHGGNPGKDGEGDNRIQAYNFRMCLTTVPENKVSFQKPNNYDPFQYELLARYFKKGWLWFLANDPRVPEDIHNEINRWGLSKDEFTDNDHWPHQIYVREARRMISDFVMIELHLRGLKPTPRPIGMGSYNMDSHNVQRYVDKEGNVRNEEDIEINPGGPYQISYDCIIPKAKETTNLLIPVCVSSSHIAYGSIRMEPVFMVLGQSAATAASLAIKYHLPVQKVNYEKLRKLLISQKQVLSLR